MSNQGHPTISTAAEVRFGSTERGFVGHVLASDSRRVVLAAPLPSGAGPPTPRAGVRGELVWADATDWLTLPVELSAVQHAILPLWHFRALGPATSGQRRAAVRAALAMPVQIRGADGQVAGKTVDVSEGGLQCVVDPIGRFAPEVGDQVSLSLLLQVDVDPLVARAQVVRSRPRSDGRLTVVVGFVGLADREKDILRRRVFLELRNRQADGLT